MSDRCVVDTNVLIAASSIDPTSPMAQDATPVEPELRRKVWQWLFDFETSERRLVLDREGKIDAEYRNKLGFNDYGLQVLLHKYSVWQIDQVSISLDSDGYAMLEPGLMSVVSDRSDRKLVAAAIDAKNRYGECGIANAADTDWYDWEDALCAEGLEVEQVLPEWSRRRWEEKKQR